MTTPTNTISSIIIDPDQKRILCVVPRGRYESYFLAPAGLDDEGAGELAQATIAQAKSDPDYRSSQYETVSAAMEQAGFIELCSTHVGEDMYE